MVFKKSFSRGGGSDATEIGSFAPLRETFSGTEVSYEK